MKLFEINREGRRDMILQKKEMVIKTETVPEHRLVFRFLNADSEELKGMEFTFQGDRAVFKVGEGETNHY